MEESTITAEGRAGPGSFWIGADHVDILVKNRATATQVAAFLTLARFTNETGMFSSAGRKAVKNSLGNCGDTVADRALLQLQQMKIIYSAEAWSKRKGAAEVPQRPTEHSRVRWVFDVARTKPESRIWIGNNLVDGYGKFQTPLKRLKQCGDVAARLLLLLYRGNNMEGFGGVPPKNYACIEYEMEKKGCIGRHFDLWHADKPKQSAFRSVALPALGLSSFSQLKERREDEWVPFWEALRSLMACGFAYEVVTVMDGPSDSEESQPIYELDVRSRHGYKPKGEEGLGGRTARISGIWNFPVTDSLGRFRDCYAAIVPGGIKCHVTGVLRMRFRVTNPKNYSVVSAWQRIGSNRNEASDWIAELESPLKRSHPNLFPPSECLGDRDVVPDLAVAG